MVLLLMLGLFGSDSVALASAWDFSDPNCREFKDEHWLF
jgi:hypothetical protein